jgi:hypothetical protein
MITVYKPDDYISEKVFEISKSEKTKDRILKTEMPDGDLYNVY